MLDSRTVSVLMVITAGLAALTLALVGRRTLPVPGVRLWMLASLPCVLGMGLSGGRESLPPLVGIVLSNILMVAAVAIQLAGYRRFVGRSAALLPALIGSVGLGPGLAWFAVISPSVAARVVIMSVALGLLCLLIALTLLRPGPVAPLPRLCCGLFHLGLVLFYFGRAWVAWGTSIPEYLTSGAIALSAHLVGFIQIVLSAFFQMVLIAEWLIADISRQASLDPLTGILNRRAFTTMAGKMLATATRAERPAALLMLDLDHFKRVNDTRGHAFGDALLCCFAKVVTDQLRSGDAFCRQGGEEFAILLAETDPARALAVAERLRQSFAAAPCAAEINATVSIGIASRQSGDTLEDLLRRADRALYQAKNGGRNRCVPSD